MGWGRRSLPLWHSRRPGASQRQARGRCGLAVDPSRPWACGWTCGVRCCAWRWDGRLPPTGWVWLSMRIRTGGRPCEDIIVRQSGSVQASSVHGSFERKRVNGFSNEWMLAVLATLLPAEQVEQLRTPDPEGRSLWERVLEDRMVAEAELLAGMSTRCRPPIADLSTASPQTRDVLPEQLARRYAVLPIEVTDSLLVVATANPFDVGAEQALAFATGREVRMALATPPRILERIDELYGVGVN